MNRWRLVPEFLLRRAGFPFERLSSLQCPEAARCAAALVELDRERAALKAELLGGIIPEAVTRAHARSDRAALKALSGWRKKVGRGHPEPLSAGDLEPALAAASQRWVELGGRVNDARAGLEETLHAELLASRRALRSFFRLEEAQHALFLLSPDLVDAMEAALNAEPSETAAHDERALERRLYTFLQRLAGKNETTSFFGPLAYGRVEPGARDFAFGPALPGGVSRREAFCAFWAAAALGRAAAQDKALRPLLAIRRIPVASVRGAEATRPDGARVPVDALSAAIYERVDGLRTARQLAQEVGADPAEVEARVVRLEKHGVVQRDLEPLSTTGRPLDDVIARLPHVPEAAQWRAAMDELRRLLSLFEQAALPARRKLLQQAEATFERVTGQPARRAKGQTYADRTVLYEDCLGDLQPVVMPGGEAERLERALAPVLDLGATNGLLRYRAVRALASTVMARFGDRAPFLAFAEAMDKEVEAGALTPLLEPARALRAELASRVSRASDGRVAKLSPGSLAELIQTEGTGRFASPDVMLERAPDGSSRLVIGEVHPYVFAWGSQGHFSPDKERMEATFREDLSPWGGASRLAVVLRRRRHKGLVSQAFPGTFIEVTGRATDDPERRVAISALEVRAGAKGPELFGPQGPLTLYVGEDDHPHLRAFAPPQVEMPPVRLGQHTPRIELGEVVFQRERWDLPEGSAREVVEAKSSAALFEAVAKARAHLRWPRHVFAMSPTEPKPICLDLEVPFAHSLLQRLLALGPLSLSEMLPSPHGLWLERDGAPHTSELRMALVRHP